MQHPAAMLYVCRGLVGVPGLSGRTEPIYEGESGHGWLFLFHVLPLADYSIEVESIDPGMRTIRTLERSSLLTSLHHAFSVEPLDEHTSRYVDLVDVDAGPLTPMVAGFAEVFYRYRQMRWRRLASRHLSSASEAA